MDRLDGASAASRSTCRRRATAAGRPPRSKRSPLSSTSFSVRWRSSARSWSDTRCRAGWPAVYAATYPTRGVVADRQRSRHPALRPARPATRAGTARPRVRRGVANVRGQPRTRADPRADPLAGARDPRGGPGRHRRLLGDRAAHRSGRAPGVHRPPAPQTRRAVPRPFSAGRSPTASASGSGGCRTFSSRNGQETATSSTSSIPTASPPGSASSSTIAPLPADETRQRAGTGSGSILTRCGRRTIPGPRPPPKADAAAQLVDLIDQRLDLADPLDRRHHRPQRIVPRGVDRVAQRSELPAQPVQRRAAARAGEGRSSSHGPGAGADLTVAGNASVMRRSRRRAVWPSSAGTCRCAQP